MIPTTENEPMSTPAEVNSVGLSKVRRSSSEPREPEELQVLKERGVSRSDRTRLARIKKDETRLRAISLVAAGWGIDEAIAQATLPVNATCEVVGDPTAPRRDEADMSDDEWLETYCGEVLARLKYQAAYRKDAILYRKIREKIHAFKTGTKNALSQSKAQLVGPFHYRCIGLVNTDHPSRWRPCGPCQSSGMSGNMSKCGCCNGHAYSIK